MDLLIIIADAYLSLLEHLAVFVGLVLGVDAFFKRAKLRLTFASIS